jgi:hypothetical protein
MKVHGIFVFTIKNYITEIVNAVILKFYYRKNAVINLNNNS